MTTSSLAIVNRFPADWSTGWIEPFERTIHPDCVWKQSGFPDAVGKSQVMALLREMVSTYSISRAEVKILRIAATGDVVIAERIDRMTPEGSEPHDTEVVGVFEVRDGLIAYYADYFDPTPYLAAKAQLVPLV